MTLHEVSDPILRITGKNLGSCEIQLEAFSLQPFSGEYRNMLTIFNATVMGKEDVQIFERREEGGRIEEGGGKREEVLTKKSISEREMYKEKMMEKEEEKEDEEVKMEENGRRVYEYIACPGQIKFGLEDYFWGPALEYNFESNLTKNVNESNISPQINKIEKFSINLDFLQKDAIFTRINTNPYFDNEILQFIQISVKISISFFILLLLLFFLYLSIFLSSPLSSSSHSFLPSFLPYFLPHFPPFSSFSSILFLTSFSPSINFFFSSELHFIYFQMHN